MRISDYETTKQPNSRDFETETKKSAGAPEPPALPSLAPLYMLDMAQRAHYVSRFDTHYPRLETYHANKEQCLI